MKNQQNNPSDTKPNNPKGNNRKRFNKPRQPRNFWKSMLTNKFFDLFVVVAGVSLAFYLNSLKVAADQQKLERFYIENLRADLDKDIEELQKNLAEIKADNETVVGYVQQYGQGAVVGDSLASVVSVILSLDTFDGSNNTYASLIGTSGLSALADPTLRSLVAEYYNQYKSIERFEMVYTNALFEINSYFTPYCDYTLRKIVDRSVLTKVQTKNNLLIAAAQLEDGIESYEDALVLALALKKTLNVD